MLLLLCAATTLANQPQTVPAQTSNVEAPAPAPAPAAQAPGRMVLETIVVSGNRPEPGVQIILSRPSIPVPSTEQLLQEIDQRLALEEGKR